MLLLHLDLVLVPLLLDCDVSNIAGMSVVDLYVSVVRCIRA